MEPSAGAWLEALHPEDRGRVLESWQKAITEGRRWSSEYRYQHPDGRIVWVIARASSLQVKDTVVGHVRTLEDITRLKEVEASLSESNKKLQAHAGQLEKEVQDRTAKLEEAFAELDLLSYSIVHDMRAPLRAMHGFSSLLLETYAETLDSEAVGLLRRISTAASKQDELITGVLAYHSYVRDKFPIAPVNLDESVTSILDTYANLQPPNVSIDIRKPLGWVLGHDTLLMQSISALLNNAIKFVAPGTKPHVSIWSEKTGSQVKLWIADNGIGIAPEHHKRIFNIFETLNDSRTFPGRGIGLPLTKKAVERMDGKIGVESEVGKGARFWICLPSAQHTASEEPKTTEPCR